MIDGLAKPPVQYVAQRERDEFASPAQNFSDDHGNSGSAKRPIDNDDLPMTTILPTEAMDPKVVTIGREVTNDQDNVGVNDLFQTGLTSADETLLLPTKKRRGRPPMSAPNSGSPYKRPLRQGSQGPPRRRKPKATDRSSEFLISWLLEHYEASDSISLPRTAIFSRYTSESLAIGLPPINPASFGKVIRAVFKGVRTRRLGTRGHSKYHYFGIAPRSTKEATEGKASVTESETATEGAVQGEPLVKGKPSCLLVAQEFLRRIYKHQARLEQREREKGEGSQTVGEEGCSLLNGQQQQIASLSDLDSASSCASDDEVGGRRGRQGRGKIKESTKTGKDSKEKDVFSGINKAEGSKGQVPNTDAQAALQAGQQPVACLEVPYDPLIPDFNEFARFLSQICQPIMEKVLGVGITIRQMCAFSALYQGHIIHLLRLISAREFHLVEGVLNHFWSTIPIDLYGCFQCQEALRIISIADDYLFQVAIHILVPDVLEPLPLPIAQAIRFFAKSLDVAIGAGGVSALFDTSIPQAIQVAKLEAASRFSAVLRRRTALNHLAQAVKNILGSGENRGVMLIDWANLDWFAIQEQLHWIMPGQADWVVFVESGWRGHLNEGSSLHQWILWLEIMVDTCLGSDATLGVDMEVSARTIIMRWSLLTSLIMRDMTLRSAASFGTPKLGSLLLIDFVGSYHLLRMFLDEYVMYYLEKRVDEQRRAIGLLAHWPPQMTLAGPNDHDVAGGAEGRLAQLDLQQHQHMSYEKVMAGFASMDELFRKSGLLAYTQQQ